MKRYLVIAALSLGACAKSEPVPERAPAPALAAGRATYGAAIEADAESTTLTDVLAKPDAFADKSVTLTGEVRQACSVKGCWMELAPSADGPAGARVTFKDYGFFVPTDSKGSHARVQGVVAVKTIDAAEVAHMEGEGGTVHCKNADGTAREVRIVATGVELWRG